MTAALVSTLSDVLAGVRALLAQVGALRDPNTNPGGIEFLVGERYLSENGAPPRLVFVREDGVDGPVLEQGARQISGISETVRVYVWGAETTDDLDRLRAAEALWHRVRNCFAALPVGRLRGLPSRRGRDTNVVTYGEELQRLIEYTYGVPYDDEIFAAAYALAPSPPLSPPSPDQPNGSTGQTFVTTPIVLSNTRP